MNRLKCSIVWNVWIGHELFRPYLYIKDDTVNYIFNNINYCIKEVVEENLPQRTNNEATNLAIARVMKEVA